MTTFLPNIDLVDNIGYMLSLFDEEDICCIYFVCHDGAVKIGRTNNIKKRMRDIQTSCYSKTELIYTFWSNKDTETELHNVFDDLRLKGEWFLYNAQFVSRLQKYMKTYDAWWNDVKAWIDDGGEGFSPVQEVSY